MYKSNYKCTVYTLKRYIELSEILYKVESSKIILMMIKKNILLIYEQHNMK